MENKPTYEELQAQVEALRLAALNAISFMSGGEAKAQLRDAYDATPQQHLAEIRAQAVQDFIQFMYSQDNCQLCNSSLDIASQYANNIRKGGTK